MPPCAGSNPAAPASFFILHRFRTLRSDGHAGMHAARRCSYPIRRRVLATDRRGWQVRRQVHLLHARCAVVTLQMAGDAKA